MNEIESLLLSGADVNTKDHEDFTLLMSFVKKNDIKVVKILLEFGAKTSLKDFRNLTALDYAIGNNNTKIVKLLVEGGAEITNDSYMLAVEGNHKEIVFFFDTFDPNKQIFLKNRSK